MRVLRYRINVNSITVKSVVVHVCTFVKDVQLVSHDLGFEKYLRFGNEAVLE